MQKEHEKINHDKIILTCGHCFNSTVHEVLNETVGRRLFEEMDGEKYYEPYKFVLLQCTTCKCVSLCGDFIWAGDKPAEELPLLYPSFAGTAVPGQGRRRRQFVRQTGGPV